MAELLKAIAHLPEEEQKTFFETIKQAPNKAVASIIEKSVEKGVDNFPALLALGMAALNQ